MKPKIVRQGDVLLRRIKTIPASAVLIQEKERIVLAYGEATGHMHALYDLDAVDVFVGDGVMYLHVRTPVDLEHEEHAPITLTPGKYIRVLQREYAPEAVHGVRD